MTHIESSIIRSLILKLDLSPSSSGLQLATIANGVIAEAVRLGFLDRRPQHNAERQLKDQISEVVWGLILEGVLAPGTGWQSPNLPFLRLTEYGKKCVAAGDVLPHDPDDYLARLKQLCPSIDGLTLLYLGEALQTFRAGNHLATAVMIGVAAEPTLLRLVESVHQSLDTPQKQAKFEQATKGKPIKKQHWELLARLRSPARPLPATLTDVLHQHLGGIYDLIRRTRNDAGHPQGVSLNAMRQTLSCCFSRSTVERCTA